MDGSVIVPLYVYPAIGAWDPVFTLAASYPDVHFTAVVNIHNGAGQGALPDQAYSDAIVELNSYANIRTVGYVSTAWCTRDLSAVIDDIAAYAFWSYYDSSLAMEGIFFDEIPTIYSLENVSYLQSIAQAVHSSDDMDYIVHNPGALPDSRYFDDANNMNSTLLSPDLTIIFEDAYMNWGTKNATLAQATTGYDRTNLGLLLHSVPELTGSAMEDTLLQLLAVGQSIWLTGTADYKHLDDHFPIVVDHLASLVS